jgi:DNA-binding CsgD family transcriptional regulator
MSEVVTPRELHRLPLYEQFFRPLGVEEQLELPLERSGTRTIALGFNRERATFTARERQLLEAFRPHVLAAARAAQQASALHLPWRGLERALEGPGCALLVVDRSGTVSAGTDVAWRLLRACFGARAGAAMQLPEVLRGWLRAELDALDALDAVPAAPRPFVGAFSGATLTVHQLPNAVSGSPVLVLEEERALSAGLLAERFALTPREAEVLRWLVDGKSNAEIAAILEMQVGTVKKHLERIFAKLGCDSRAAALALAREATRSLGAKGG